MKASEWARREGLNQQTVWRWCREGRMPVPFERTETGTILVHDPKYEDAVPAVSGRVVCYARVSSSDQRGDLERQCDRLRAFAVAMGCERPEVVSEVGSGMNEKRRKINRLLADPTVGTIVVEHRERLARMNAGLVESALAAQGRRLVVVDDSELENDLVRDMTEVLTSFCARLYGRRSAKNRARAALAAAEACDA